MWILTQWSPRQNKCKQQASASPEDPLQTANNLVGTILYKGLIRIPLMMLLAGNELTVAVS